MKQTATKDSDEGGLLIGAGAGEAARISEELGSVSDEGVRIEWVKELSNGIDRLRGGKVAAVALDQTSPDSGGIETVAKLFQAAPRVPILVLGGVYAGETARETAKRGAPNDLVKSSSDGNRLGRAVRTHAG